MHQHSITALRALAQQFSNPNSCASEIARLEGELSRKDPSIHLISDIHGESRKLRHVINNASGTLRPIVEKLYSDSKNDEEIALLLNLIYYPQHTMDFLQAYKMEWSTFVNHLLDMVHVAAFQIQTRSFKEVRKLLDDDYEDLLCEILYTNRNPIAGKAFVENCLTSLHNSGKHLHFLRVLARLIRNLTIDELVVAGDLYDRGPRGDKVVEILMQQPKAWVAWGNHDIVWIGACLGQQACIGHVLRVSIRYNVTQQLEEGYGIPLQPLQYLAETVYGSDPAPCHKVKFTSYAARSPELLRKMQKAAAILQYKLEGQIIANNPDFDLDHRRLLHHINFEKGTVNVDGTEYELKDTNFPTIDVNNPYELSHEEKKCMDVITNSFRSSSKMWTHMKWLVENGSLYALRNNHLIFHGAVPVNKDGSLKSMKIGGQTYSGKELFDVLNQKVLNSIQDGLIEENRDWCWYLWCGPVSPLFGKDRIATFERDFIAEGPSWVENKDPYFKLIHEEEFCEKVCQLFGCQKDVGIIVNGHVPVKIAQGENPVKRSNRAVTIDGAFSEAYGDKGFTMIVEENQTLLAEHAHFESIEASLKEGKDMIPKVTSICVEAAKKRDRSRNERVLATKDQIEFLKQLMTAYKQNLV